MASVVYFNEIGFPLYDDFIDRNMGCTAISSSLFKVIQKGFLETQNKYLKVCNITLRSDAYNLSITNLMKDFSVGKSKPPRVVSTKRINPVEDYLGKSTAILAQFLKNIEIAYSLKTSPTNMTVTVKPTKCTRKYSQDILLDLKPIYSYLRT